jgi:hypothetical protein
LFYKLDKVVAKVISDLTGYGILAAALRYGHPLTVFMLIDSRHVGPGV